MNTLPQIEFWEHEVHVGISLINDSQANEVVIYLLNTLKAIAVGRNDYRMLIDVRKALNDAQSATSTAKEAKEMAEDIMRIASDLGLLCRSMVAFTLSEWLHSYNWKICNRSN